MSYSYPNVFGSGRGAVDAVVTNFRGVWFRNLKYTLTGRDNSAQSSPCAFGYLPGAFNRILGCGRQ